MNIFLSPAKINLFLHILSKRDDGYHNIFSLFYPISLCDILQISKAEDFSIICRANIPNVPIDDIEKDNIIFKVDSILREEYGLKDNYSVVLEKNIPVMAGLGGGSSNAMTYLKAVNKLSCLELTDEDMFSIANRVGSDTTFFLKNKASIVSARGELIERVTVDRLYFIILNPNIHISTKEIYASKELVFSKNDILNEVKLTHYSFDDIMSNLYNGMYAAVYNKYSEIADVIELLESVSGKKNSLMSGSGSTCFSVFSSAEERDEAFLKLVEKMRHSYTDYFIAKSELYV